MKKSSLQGGRARSCPGAVPGLVLGGLERAQQEVRRVETAQGWPGKVLILVLSGALFWGGGLCLGLPHTDHGDSARHPRERGPSSGARGDNGSSLCPRDVPPFLSGCRGDAPPSCLLAGVSPGGS